MSRPPDFESFVQSLILGTHRQAPVLPEAVRQTLPDGVDEDAALLGALAFASQRARFLRSPKVVPKPPPRDIAAQDLVPDEARAAVRALLSGRGEEARSDSVRSTLTFLQQSGKRLHPFDLSRIESAARAHPDLLHPADRRALGLESPPDSDDWTDLSPRSVRRLFTDLRRREPARARDLLEPEFSSLKASLRKEIIQTFDRNLSEADRPFLESLAGDKSRTVRAEVESMLGRLPGTEAHARRLERLAEDLSLTKDVLRKTSIGVARGVQTQTVVERARGLSLVDLLGAIKIPRADFVKSRPKIAAPLLSTFLEGAMRDDDAEAVEILLRRGGTDWHSFLLAADPSLPLPVLARHLPIVPVMADPRHVWALVELVSDRFGSPLPRPVAEALARALGPARLTGPVLPLLPADVLVALADAQPPDHPLHEEPWLVLARLLPSPPSP
ncbi:MAG: DUF5691 domain-containing protein [Myxococcota bacterium]